MCFTVCKDDAGADVLETFPKAHCSVLSHRQDYVSYNQINAGGLDSSGYMKLKPESDHGSDLYTQFTYRYSSPNMTKHSAMSC